MQLHWITTYLHCTGVPFCTSWLRHIALNWTHWTVDRLQWYAGEAYWRGKIGGGLLLLLAKSRKRQMCCQFSQDFKKMLDVKFFNRKPFNLVEGREKSAFFRLTMLTWMLPAPSCTCSELSANLPPGANHWQSKSPDFPNRAIWLLLDGSRVSYLIG